MIEPHAIEPHLQQLVHGQLAPGIRQTHHDAIHRTGTDDRGNLVDGANHSRIQHRRSDSGRIRVHEADDFHTQVVSSIEQLTNQANGGGVDAHEK